SLKTSIKTITNLSDTNCLEIQGASLNLSITKLAVALDYDAVDALGVRFKDTVNLEVRRARRWEVWQWFWNHPDQSVQLSIKLGVVGAVLGVMGFLTGVAPYLLG
ncbi:hypothetical protein VC940_22115, partial [Citrobacter freundii]|nr:hypothetical protein [Citrobacter freundii]